MINKAPTALHPTMETDMEADTSKATIEKIQMAQKELDISNIRYMLGAAVGPSLVTLAVWVSIPLAWWMIFVIGILFGVASIVNALAFNAKGGFLVGISITLVLFSVIGIWLTLPLNLNFLGPITAGTLVVGLLNVLGSLRKPE